MKKLIAMLLAVVLVMGLVACGSTANNNVTPNNGSNNAGTTGTEGTEGSEGTNDTAAGNETTAPEDDFLNEDEENAPTETTAPAVDANAATEVLDAIWQAIPEDSSFFVMGGDMNAMVSDGAGNYSLEDEGLTYSLYVPADQVANLTCASSLMHGMIANNFTCGLYQVSGDAAAFADAMKASIGSAQWICGQPEKLLISVINEEFVLVAFGINDALAPFEAALSTVYADANTLYNEAIAG